MNINMKILVIWITVQMVLMKVVMILVSNVKSKTVQYVLIQQIYVMNVMTIII